MRRRGARRCPGAAQVSVRRKPELCVGGRGRRRETRAWVPGGGRTHEGPSGPTGGAAGSPGGVALPKGACPSEWAGPAAATLWSGVSVVGAALGCPGAPATMSWSLAARAWTRLVRSGSGLAGRLGGRTAGVATSGYGACEGGWARMPGLAVSRGPEPARVHPPRAPGTRRREVGVRSCTSRGSPALCSCRSCSRPCTPGGSRGAPA